MMDDRESAMQDAPRTEGSPWLKDLYDLFAPVRESAAEYTEEAINEIIDQAVRAVRCGDD